MSNRVQQALDHEVRIEKVVDFASMWSSLQDLTHVPDELEEVFEDSYDLKHLHPSMVPFMKYLDLGDDKEADNLLEKLQDFPSQYADVIFMQGATPVRDYHGPNGWSSGWGRCYTGWVAAPTFTRAWALLVKWAKDMHDTDKAKAMSKPGVHS